MVAATPVQPDQIEVLDEAHLSDPTEWLLRLMMERRSIRRYRNRPIPRDLLEKILRCATWAPSAHNRQPWRFCVVSGQDSKALLARNMGERWFAELRADGVDENIATSRVAVSHIRLTSAAALIVASLCTDDMDVYPDERRQAAEHTMAVQSVALACQNLLLAAHAHGLGACWMCAPLFAPDIVGATLVLPDTWQPQALITLGYPAEVRQSTRKAIESCAIWRE